MLGLYVPGTSPLHRLPAGAKLIGLAAAGAALALVDGWAVPAVVLAATVVAGASAGLPLRAGLAAFRGPALLLAVLFAVQAVLAGWEAAAATVLALAALIALAVLVTLTTPPSAMISAFQRALAPLRPLGVHPGKVGFTLALTIRLVPVLFGIAREVIDAQRARGLGRNPLALAVPIVIRALRLADTLSEAIIARGWDPDAGDARADRDP
jgi:biotin transport system permease protein